MECDRRSSLLVPISGHNRVGKLQHKRKSGTEPRPNGIRPIKGIVSRDKAMGHKDRLLVFRYFQIFNSNAIIFILLLYCTRCKTCSYNGLWSLCLKNNESDMCFYSRRRQGGYRRKPTTQTQTFEEKDNNRRYILPREKTTLFY